MRRTKSLIQLVFYYWLALTTYAGEANYTTNNNYTNGINYANTSLRFTHYDNDDGLSQNSAYAIVKDKHGFIWIGTQDGLNRFDGYQFKQFKHDSSNPYSISGSYILSLFIDESGELWIGTFNGGLNHFDYATERFTSYQHDAENSSSISSNRISSNSIQKNYSLEP